jgi:hypothetical protein
MYDMPGDDDLRLLRPGDRPRDFGHLPDADS